MENGAVRILLVVDVYWIIFITFEDDENQFSDCFEVEFVKVTRHQLLTLLLYF